MCIEMRESSFDRNNPIILSLLLKGAEVRVKPRTTIAELVVFVQSRNALDRIWLMCGPQRRMRSKRKPIVDDESDDQDSDGRIKLKRIFQRLVLRVGYAWKELFLLN
ncbi:unnamed protein product [Ceratitis capitata]|uniref:(Mediterranean fruit fly) hypothetical protein n=1 Tax=Ceratitis capitata TaxID=7213 RepID=A0A811UQR4_CERCA|nr:unnamed protein product [Ceratitis capitata]